MASNAPQSSTAALPSYNAATSNTSLPINNEASSSTTTTTTTAAALPSYSAATTDPSLTSNDVGSDYAYADFTISDLRAQILANAAIVKPIYSAEKSRSEYELELVLMRGSTGQHAAMLLRRNTTQTLSYDTRHGKIVLRGKAHVGPRQAYESLLAKTETILGDLLRSSKIEHSLPREMNGWNPRQYD